MLIYNSKVKGPITFKAETKGPITFKAETIDDGIKLGSIMAKLNEKKVCYKVLMEETNQTGIIINHCDLVDLLT